MTAQQTAFAEIERLVKSFRGMAIRVDDEINRRVYALYGLTEEEIAVVEGRR